MKKLYHLKSCSTCARVIKDLELPEDVMLQDIKSKPITEQQIDELAQRAGGYEALFSKRAKLYKEKGLKDQQLSEVDFKTYLLEHYTFLSRPVLVYNDQIFVGNSSKTVAAAKAFIHADE
ncbi:MAG: ArsC/Spx/MgsR family protein [Psychroserpens sp.]|uniref:arsenate reductase family protein n=1 Tax=Psychroserpens sp. TaxID=2020870 RepID=UPI003C782838